MKCTNNNTKKNLRIMFAEKKSGLIRVTIFWRIRPLPYTRNKI